MSVPDVDGWTGRTPVLVDDIVSAARTTIETATRFREAGFADIVAVAIHALFAGNAYRDLLGAGVHRIVTCNTVLHPSNAIDLTEAMAEAARGAVKTMIAERGLGQETRL